ncbi:alpha/beta fold hydrolase [Methylobacterium trifolii]|uniref:alpha/beta fold hydrolase n=1 Tax=Methylobacterium trifolii TaxID=1003092 RepID=UPI0035A242AD
MLAFGLGLLAALIGGALALSAAASLAITVWVGAKHPPAGPFVAVDKGRLATIQAGPETGARATVVLLHGASANAADPMEGVGRLLAARGFRVIAFDRPGFGWSDRLDSAAAASPAVQGAAIAQALERMGVGPAIVLGHSWAGTLALSLALDHPERVAGLALVSAVAMPFKQERRLPWYWRMAVAPPVAWLLSRTIGPPLALYYLNGAGRGAFLPQTETGGYVERARAALVVRPATLLANVQDLLGLPAALERQSPRYGSIRVPTLVIAGDADPIVKSDLQSGPLAAAIPGARLVLLPGIGHMVPWVATERLADEVSRLADRIAEGAPAP